MTVVAAGSDPYRNDRFPAVSHEQALDRQMLIAQEQAVFVGAIARAPLLVQAVCALCEFMLDRLPNSGAKHLAVEHLHQAQKRHARPIAELQPYLAKIRTPRAELETLVAGEGESHVDKVAREKLVAIERYLAGQVLPLERRHGRFPSLLRRLAARLFGRRQA